MCLSKSNDSVIDSTVKYKITRIKTIMVQFLGIK